MAPAGNVARSRSLTIADRPESDRTYAAHWAARLVSDVAAVQRRRQRLARVREAIDASDYENDLKLSVAVDRLIDRHALQAQ